LGIGVLLRLEQTTTIVWIRAKAQLQEDGRRGLGNEVSQIHEYETEQEHPDTASDDHRSAPYLHITTTFPT